MKKTFDKCLNFFHTFSLKNRFPGDYFIYGIGNCSYSGGTPTRIALAILGVQRADVALFYGTGNGKKGKWRIL